MGKVCVDFLNFILYIILNFKKICINHECFLFVFFIISYRGSPNIEMDEHTFMVNRERAVDYLNSLDKVLH